MTLQPFITRLEEGETLRRETSLFILRATGAKTGGAFTLVESSRVTVGDGPGLHMHTREDETFIVLHGRYRFIVDSEDFEAEPGAVVFAPRNRRHRFEVLSTDSRLLHLFIPGGIDAYFREQWTATRNGHLKELAASYGIQFFD